ncbi:amidase [Bradyrhizobium sp. CCBAU 51753]|uniref:amidase n=1 Tax=Bradyrhizobium sp. CCBAU 51753 TaxID=1325100 RepID=UPI00188D37E6|nr:amidase [Bradyrhizobium sp. CCBAU 51753]QOZ28094.1 Asp-tRNA(Asn)/Glu-tRNA(Gln) amidotransferase GatCAB subunit A [Bradyrhizobium sp. CCBAU 51753]
MSADPLHYKSITEISELFRRGEPLSSEVTAAILSRIAKLDGKFHGYATVLAERAMAQAERCDDEIGRGIWRGPLHGVPIGLKDLCYTTFAPTAGGTTIHANFVPSFNATIVDRLERAGAVTLGKLKMTEGAYTSHHPNDQAPLNPWNIDYWVGSSSSGSGVATSAGLCYGSIGSDTGGSIRFPSATCGLTGIKPTWGRVSRHGVFPLADSLDHVGPMCRSAADAAAMLGVIAGADINDPTTLRAPVPNYLAGLGDGIRGLRIGVDRKYTQEGIDPQVVAALKDAERMLADLGADIREIKFPAYEKLVSMWIPMCSIETAEAHLGTYPSRKSEYGPDLAQLIEQGRSMSGIEIAAVHHERLKFSGSLAALFGDIDLLLIPTMPVPIPTLTKMGEYGADPNVLLSILRFTAVFDFSGSPTITLPMGLASDNMPLSMQLVGPHLSEDVLARAGHAFQSATDWHTRRPPLD